MKSLLLAAYLGFWLALAAALVYIGALFGHSPWITAPIAFVLFLFVNGNLAYIARSRQNRLEGKEPPKYFAYVFQTEKVREPVRFPAVIRIAIGLIVLLGGLLFVMAGGLFLLHAAEQRSFLLVGCIFVFLGAAFVYVGYRVIRMTRPERRLFGRDRPAN